MFTNRTEAGKLLSEKLASQTGNVVVLGLARGGVVVASVVASSLGAPLDVLVIKKLPSPFDPELGIGAVAPDGVFLINWALAQRTGADEQYIQDAIGRQSEVIRQKILLYRKGKNLMSVKGKTVMLVDDGAATGATMEVAIKWCKKKGARRIICALPVAAKDTVAKLKPEVDELIVLNTPETFSSVGESYKEFGQVEDEEVVKILAVSHQPSAISS